METELLVIRTSGGQLRGTKKKIKNCAGKKKKGP